MRRGRRREADPWVARCTKGHRCEGCGNLGHIFAQCWTEHPELCPPNLTTERNRPIVRPKRRSRTARKSGGGIFSLEQFGTWCWRGAWHECQMYACGDRAFSCVHARHIARVGMRVLLIASHTYGRPRVQIFRTWYDMWRYCSSD